MDRYAMMFAYNQIIARHAHRGLVHWTITPAEYTAMVQELAEALGPDHIAEETIDGRLWVALYGPRGGFLTNTGFFIEVD